MPPQGSEGRGGVDPQGSEGRGGVARQGSEGRGGVDRLRQETVSLEVCARLCRHQSAAR